MVYLYIWSDGSTDTSTEHNTPLYIMTREKHCSSAPNLYPHYISYFMVTVITVTQHQQNGFAWQHPETSRNKPLSFISFLEVEKVRPRCVHSALCKYRTGQGSDTASHSSAVLCRQHLLLPPALQGWSWKKSLTTGIKFSPRARKSKSNLKDEWKTQHWWGGVFPHWKKKNPEFSYPSPPYSKRSPKKITQSTALLLLCWCQLLQNKKDEAVQAQPARCQKTSLQSLCMLQKNTSWDVIKSRPCTFLPHIYQYACAMITKIAVNSSSDSKYCYPIYSPNHLQEEARTCSS